MAQILGSSLNENYDSAGHKISTRTQQDDVLRTTIKLYNGANALTLVEEKLEGDAKLILERVGGRDWLTSRLRAYEKESGDKLLRAVADDTELQPSDLIEAWSHLGQSYLLGRSNFGAPLQNGRMAGMLQSMASAGLSSAFNAESQFWNMVQARAQKLRELHASGKLDAAMVAELESQLGIGARTDVEAQAGLASGTSLDQETFSMMDPQSWDDVRPGTPWNTAKKFLPKLQDNRGKFFTRGEWKDLVQRVAKWLGLMGSVKDPWGGTVQLNNPQRRGQFSDEMENRAAHLLGRDLGNERRVQAPEKVDWIGSVTKTISDAQVMVKDGNELLYFRSYKEGVHMVVVEAGAVKDHYGLVSQYAPGLKAQSRGATVVKTRSAGLAPQGGAGSVSLPVLHVPTSLAADQKSQNRTAQTPTPGAQENTTGNSTDSQATPHQHNNETLSLRPIGSDSPPPVYSSSQPPGEKVVASTASTMNPVQEKMQLAELGYPQEETKRYVDRYYDPEKYKDLAGNDTAWLVMPSTSGKNIIPLMLADRLATDLGGTVVNEGIVLIQTEQAKTKRGYMAKMEAPAEAMIADPSFVEQVRGKRVIIVDDIMTSGMTIEALAETLAPHGIQVEAVAVLAAVKGGEGANASQLTELAKIIASSSDLPLKQVQADVNMAHGKSRGKLLVEALREAREHPHEVYQHIKRKAETLRASLPGGR
ncbi:MAG: phosphoribosyltransferase family protein [Prosthecobacter sp.]